jgi:aminoglycoside phosphotransferase family enzyme/predicted kinase
VNDGVDRGGRLAPDLETWLRAGPLGDGACQRVMETSISWIFLYETRALKLKKPVNLGFLDFSTTPKREWAVRRELAFNRVTAPDIYLAVHPIGRDAGGVLQLRGAGPPAAAGVVDWALEMRRFDEEAMLSNRIAAIDVAFAENLGREIARFQGKAEAGAAGGGAAGLAYIVDSNARLIRQEVEDLGGAAFVEALIGATQSSFEAVALLLDRRATQGFVRACHGDLHLGNILVEQGRPVLFDCIEFSDRLREIDILYDVAFLLMDLAFRGAPQAANRVLNGWLDEAARSFAAAMDGAGARGLWEGLAALPLFQAVRATVRGHVNAYEGKRDLAGRYLAAARTWLAPPKPRLVAVGGFSGSGKSTLARSLAPSLGPAPGAVILRTDEIRKRLAGVAPTQRLEPSSYTPAASAAVYEELCDLARICLAAGQVVIADGVFLRPNERAAIEAAAGRAGVPFDGLWLEASASELERRIGGRRDDASDADARVLAAQLTQDPGSVTWRRYAAGAVSGDLAAVRRDLGLSGPTPAGARL